MRDSPYEGGGCDESLLAGSDESLLAGSKY